MTNRPSPLPSLSRRQALAGVSAAAFAVGIGAPLASASQAAVLPAEFGTLTDMTGHVPAYDAPIRFGRPAVSPALVADPYDLIFT